MVSISSSKCFSSWNNVHFVNHGHVQGKIDDKVGYALGHGYLMIDVLPQQHEPEVLSQSGHLLLERNPRWP